MDTSSKLKPDAHGFNFNSSYTQLPSIFYQQQQPTKVGAPSIAIFNEPLAIMLGLDVSALKKDGLKYLSGNTEFADSNPIAQAYAGHQFGSFNILGDGRAILLGEHITPKKQRFDIQLKGSGRTAYSRTGDGRAALGPMLREYIFSEAMYALGIPTTRSLAVVKTGETVYRDDESQGAILTRIATSHIRVGTFQFAAATKDYDALKALADYTISRHFPEIICEDNKYLKMLEKVIALQASLIAKWMHVGFIHGVMNTDNMSICGETIDYGPCAFMNTYKPETVFSSIDTQGRYAFANQPKIAHWNLIRFAETLLPLISDKKDESIELVKEYLEKFPSEFLEFWLSGMRKKLGLFNSESDDLKLAEELLMYLYKNKADYTNTFRLLRNNSIKEMQIYNDAEFRIWLDQWDSRLLRQTETLDQSVELMNRSNPAVIPRNHLVEEALKGAVDYNDMTLMHDLLSAISAPYSEPTCHTKYTQAPEFSYDLNYKTFCGT